MRIMKVSSLPSCFSATINSLGKSNEMVPLSVDSIRTIIEKT